VAECRPEAGGEDSRVRRRLRAVRRDDAPRGEPHEHRLGGESAGVARLAHGRYGDDVAEAARRLGRAALLQRLIARRRLAEQVSAVDLVGEICGRPQRRPGDARDLRELGGDLRARVAAPDDDHAAADEWRWAGIVRRVQHEAAE
jgi:hypothetical protein